MTTCKGFDFLRRIGPRSAIPVHYDDYRVFRSPLTAFLDRARREELAGIIRPVSRGETVELV